MRPTGAPIDPRSLGVDPVEDPYAERINAMPTVVATPSFGVKTTPAAVSYEELRRVWLDADKTPEIEHAWLYDHLLPRVGDPAEPVYEAWTLLAALAAQTRRLRFGLLVTNTRIRRPAVLAKMAATLDVISDGRLDFGIGIGGLPDAGEVARSTTPTTSPRRVARCRRRPRRGVLPDPAAVDRGRRLLRRRATTG